MESWSNNNLGQVCASRQECKLAIIIHLQSISHPPLPVSQQHQYLSTTTCSLQSHSLKYAASRTTHPHFLSKMGRCGDEDGDDSNLLSHHLLPADPATATTSTVISPMNSQFSALTCSYTLQLIFSKLPVADLARASCVCRVWNSVASDKEIVTRAFKAPWKLKVVVGSPSSGSFWRDNGIGKFAISHRIVRGDSVASLAVKYSVQVMDIKRLNNMMSDHGIYSRERLLIPISDPSILIHRTCYIEVDAYAKREVAVLYLDGVPERKVGSLLQKVASEQGKRRVIESLKRSMHVDDGTALYYLSISNGDARAALSEFSEDLRWERKEGLA